MHMFYSSDLVQRTISARSISKQYALTMLSLVARRSPAHGHISESLDQDLCNGTIMSFSSPVGATETTQQRKNKTQSTKNTAT